MPPSAFGGIADLHRSQPALTISNDASQTTADCGYIQTSKFHPADEVRKSGRQQLFGLNIQNILVLPDPTDKVFEAKGPQPTNKASLNLSAEINSTILMLDTTREPISEPTNWQFGIPPESSFELVDEPKSKIRNSMVTVLQSKDGGMESQFESFLLWLAAQGFEAVYPEELEPRPLRPAD